MIRISTKPLPPSSRTATARADIVSVDKAKPSSRLQSTRQTDLKERRVTLDAVPPSEADMLSSAGASATLETKFLRGMFPLDMASHLLESDQIRQRLDDLKHDWGELIGDQNDPLVEIAKLTLERFDRDLKSLQDACHSLIEP